VQAEAAVLCSALNWQHKAVAGPRTSYMAPSIPDLGYLMMPVRVWLPQSGPAVGEADGRSDTAPGPGKARRTHGKSGMTDGRAGLVLTARSAHFAPQKVVIGVAPCPGACLPTA
jgi:hypothetical protein